MVFFCCTLQIVSICVVHCAQFTNSSTEPHGIVLKLKLIFVRRVRAILFKLKNVIEFLPYVTSWMSGQCNIIPIITQMAAEKKLIIF